MDTKIVKVSDKGQISIPMILREATGIRKGDELMMIRSGNAIVLEKIKKSDFSDLLKHSEGVAERLWDNKEDEVWDNV
ncbi:AbrB/MazE/SpoVT family DNA-binding domain-containing protein [Candidatus Woesearchaeota archaeon]|nr:AbrB/MazE/SpoVT family DNA-binding domain-containing protein [Candidatus Woesearchaeota archaeon]